MIRQIRRRVDDFRGCGHARSKLVLAAISSIASAIALRQLAAAAALLLPYDSWAQELAHVTAHLPPADFWSAAGVSALGGASSFFHELRADVTRLSFLNAFGHMTSAQFAGLMTYLATVNWGWPWELAMVAVGLAGWSGNKLVSALNDALIKRLANQIESGPLK